MKLPNYLFYKVHEALLTKRVWKRCPTVGSILFLMSYSFVSLLLLARILIRVGLWTNALTVLTLLASVIVCLLVIPIYYSSEERREHIIEIGDQLKEEGNTRYQTPGNTVMQRFIFAQLFLVVILFW